MRSYRFFVELVEIRDDGSRAVVRSEDLKPALVAEVVKFGMAKAFGRGGRKNGRPRRSDVTAALRLEAAGVARSQIYGRLGKGAPQEQHSLREAMRKRKFIVARRGKEKSGKTPPGVLDAN